MTALPRSSLARVSILDHVVIAAGDVAAGAPAVERVLGVPLAGGGKHDRMGTHNRLLRLGSDAYPELIAIDPEGTPPDRPRWASDVQRQLDLLGLAFRCAPASLPRITARFRTPVGPRTLRSSEPIR
jgi:hypothetical protein